MFKVQGFGGTMSFLMSYPGRNGTAAWDSEYGRRNCINRQKGGFRITDSGAPTQGEGTHHQPTPLRCSQSYPGIPLPSMLWYQSSDPVWVTPPHALS